MCEFGRVLRDEQFLLSKSCVHLNHGSWGTVPRKVQDQRIRLMQELENSPDHWFRRTLRQQVNESLEVAAEFLGANKNDCVFVNNATAGCNCVLKSVALKPGDAILINSYTYNAIQNTAKSAAQLRGAEVLKLEIPLEMKSIEDLVVRYKTFLSQHDNIKIIVLDYISSATGLKFPVKEIVELCKARGVLVLLDGAHSPGQLDVNLTRLGEMGVDFYTGNFHKWVFTPRACALLWSHPRHQGNLQPVVTGHSLNSGSIQDDFFHQGTIDHTAYLSVQSAIKFYRELGGLKKIQNYCCPLLDKAVAMLCESWGTHPFPVTKDMEAPFLRMIGLPEIRKYTLPQTERVFCDVHDIMTDLYNKYGIAATVLLVHGKPWVRLSCFVYNTMADYEKLRDAILEMKNE